MPLHGKIVVIKRSGGDGTEFPLTATCLFGRKPDCDIRIQLPHVSKEHCKIDLNENKEVILTNLSSSNPTRVNGKALQQSERLKHGDVITIIDRSFRFEYPPAPTPKKRSSHGGKAETLKVLQDQVGDTVIVTKGEKRISEVSSDPHLKDGGNHDNIQRSLEKTLEMESSKDDDQLQVDKTNSPFGDLYQMIKKSLDVKTPRTSSISVVQTPSSRFCTPGPASVRKKPAAFTPQREDGKVCGTPMSVKKQAPLFKVPSADVDGSRAEEAGQEADKSGAPSPRRRNSGTPQRFTVSEAIEQISTQTPKSPKRRRSKEATPARPAAGKGQEEEPETAPKSENPRRLSPRNAEKAEKESKKRKSGELGTDLPTQPMKRKRVSFGTHLSPELFDKRLPPDSPLRKGATPRRSLSLFKTKQALLRRVSVIGLLKEQSPVKKNSPSPKKPPKTQSASPKTPPGQKLPKSKSPSPKPASPAKKSPKSRSSSPKAASPSTKKVGTPKASEQPKTEDLASRGSPKSKRRSSLAMSSPASVTGATSDKTPSNSGIQTPTVQGRFSVSRISTPSPATEAAAEQEPAPTATPLLRLKRKSMKSASKKTPGVAKSAVKALQRRSGVSRASIKVMNSWVDIVKFGKSKAPVVLPTKKRITQKTAKKLVPKSQTPARKLAGHVSTGHAESPATIVVGRAHKRTVACPVGAAPRVVANTALFKKNMKMDEDLSGISEMFKTPANERKRRSLISESSSAKTPVSSQSTSVMEPSVLNTPEEPDEMMVSPLSAASTVKSRTYSSEAVQRLLDGDQESSFISDTPTVEAQSESSEQHPEDSRKTAVTTPKQKPDLPECLTGVRRIMKTPRQKAEPIEDLRGKLLKTPRQKAEQPECLTGVKRIMKTPRQKAEPIEDIRGKLLMTPKQKPEPQECLTGVKRIFKTPGRSELSDEGSDVAVELLQTPAQAPASASPPEDPAVKTPGARMSPTVCLTDFRGQAAEDAVGTKRLPRTPKQKSQPVEEHFGLRRLMKSPRVKGNPPVEDFEGLQELMAEPEAELSCQLEPNKDETPMHVDCGVQEAKEADANEVVHDGALEVPSECGKDEASQGVEALPVESKVDGAGEVPAASEPSPQKKAARGRRANPVKAADRVEASEVPAAAAPLRARRGKKAEAAAPPAVRLRTRGANAGSTQSQDVEPAEKESLPQTSEAAPQPKRGRSAKKVPDAEAVPEPESQPQADEAPERAELKLRRGRKAKAAQQEESAEVPAADVAEDAGQVDGDQPVGTEEASDAAEVCVQAQDAETETSSAMPQKRPTRGRRGKQVEPKEEEDKHQAIESSNEPVAPAQVRGGRGRRAEAAAPPAVKQPARSRHAKSQESAPNHSAAETQAATEDSSEAAAPLAEASSVAPAEEVVSKPLRGRRAKATPCEPEKTLNAEPEQPSVGKPQRGRKAKPAAVEPNEEVEAKQLSVPPVRAKRGRHAKPEEEERDTHTASEEADKSNEQAVEPAEEVQTSEVVPPEKAEAPLGTSEQAPKPRRGGRKAKAEAEAAAPVEPTEPQDVGSTDKPKRGRKNTRVPEEPAEGPEQVLKPNRAKGIKTKAKEELPLSTPAKRSRQGAAPPPQETPEEATAEPAPVQPAARGRRGAKPSSDDPAEGSSQASAQDTTKSKRSVKWKSDLEEVHIPKATPVKAVRGRKTKIANQVDAESKATSEDAGRPEEDPLSDEAPPAKRGRRAARPADLPAEPPLPRTRRGRAAKK
ncbi:proliferation marker protein Ki-67 isoform 2-T2 [Menidia menidia]